MRKGWSQVGARRALLLLSCRSAIHQFFSWIIAGLAILCAYAALFGFHTYLAVLGIGTYDWILDVRNEPATPAPRPTTELAPRAESRVADEDGV